MDTQPSFEQFLEADMHKLAEQIGEQREKQERKDIAEKELVREAIRSFPGVHRKEEGLQGEAFPQPNANAASPLPAYAQSAAPEVKLEIEYLLEVVLTKGLAAALSESKKSPEFVQDAFHDALVGKLYPVLQQKGIVK